MPWVLRACISPSLCNSHVLVLRQGMKRCGLGGTIPAMARIPPGSSQAWGGCQPARHGHGERPGLGQGMLLQKSIKKKSSESAPRAEVVGRWSARERPSLKCCFWYRFHAARSRDESRWLRTWFSLKNEANPKQWWGHPSGHFRWLSFLSVHPGVVSYHSLGIGRESGHAASAHWRLVLHPWTGAPHFLPPSQEGCLPDGAQPEIRVQILNGKDM